MFSDYITCHDSYYNIMSRKLVKQIFLDKQIHVEKSMRTYDTFHRSETLSS